MGEFQNPTEVVEDFILSQDWAYQRLSAQEIAAEVEGHWGLFRLQFYWQEEYNVFHLTCLLDLRVHAPEVKEVYHLLSLLNERLVVGHFELFSEESIPAFRHSFMISNPQALPSDLLESLISLSLEEADRFYPAFQLVIAGEKRAQEAASVAILDTAGEA